MKIGFVFFILTAVMLCGCTSVSVPVARNSNIKHTNQTANAEEVITREDIPNQYSFQPAYNPDGSITLFTFNDIQVKIMPATHRGPRSALSKTIDEYEALIAQCIGVLDANPQDYDACITLAALYIDRGSPDDAELAVKYSNQALTIIPNDPQALYIRAIAFNAQGENGKALNDLRAILNTRIQSLKGIYYVMGMIQYQTFNIDGAIESFENVKAIDPDFADINEILERLYKMKF